MLRYIRTAGVFLLAVATLIGVALATGYATTEYTVGTGMVTIAGKQMKVLTDAKDMTLYYLASDTPTQSGCSGGCSSTWPALLSTTAPTSEDPLPGKLSLVKTANGSQVAYNGHLLYRYAADTAVGQANGQGMGGKWWVASVDLKATSSGAPAKSSSGW